MKLNNLNAGFLHPVLNPGTTSYKSDKNINFYLEKKEVIKNEFVFKYNFDCNSDFINEMVKNNNAKMIIHIEQDTLRKVIKIDAASGEFTLNINDFRRGRNAILNFMVVSDKAFSFEFHEDFDDFYDDDIEYNAYKGSILAFANTIKLPIEPKLKSINHLFTVRRNENDEEIKIILDDSKIIIELSPEIYTAYFKFKNQFQLINFSLVYPALRYALLKLNENKDSNWAHTISNVIEQKTDFDPEKINDDNVDKVFSSLMKGYTGRCFLEVEQWKR